jgi:hypothetical protein
MSTFTPTKSLKAQSIDHSRQTMTNQQNEQKVDLVQISMGNTSPTRPS